MSRMPDPTDPRVSFDAAAKASIGAASDMAQAINAAVEGRKVFDENGRIKDAALGEIAREMPRAAIYLEVNEERRRQDEQWGGPEHDDTHDPPKWSDLIGCHASSLVNSRVAMGVLERETADDYRSRLIKIAALAVAAVESHDRKAKKT